MNRGSGSTRTRSGLLRALWHCLLRGESEGVPVGEQAWFREVLDEPDPERQLRLNARNSRMVKVRAGAVMEVIRSAAPSDPDIGALWARIQPTSTPTSGVSSRASTRRAPFAPTS